MTIARFWQMSLSRPAALALALTLAASGTAHAANGIARCKDGTLGEGPASGAHKFCKSHGGLDDWHAGDNLADNPRPALNILIYDAKGRPAGSRGPQAGTAELGEVEPRVLPAN